MLKPTPEELNDSIEELSAYRDRLESEVVNIAKKLKMSEQKVNSALENHAELKQIKAVLSTLIDKRDKQINDSE